MRPKKKVPSAVAQQQAPLRRRAHALGQLLHVLRDLQRLDVRAQLVPRLTQGRGSAEYERAIAQSPETH